MPKREPVPPLTERVEPSLIQKRSGKWTARFRWRGQTKDRFCGLTVAPSDEPSKRIKKLVLRKFTQPYLSGQWSPFEDDLYGPDAGPRRGPTVAEATVAFLGRYDSAKTRKNYESVLRLFEESLEPHTLVAEVVPDHVAAFVYRERVLRKGINRPITRSTQKHAWRHLRAFFNWCIKQDHIEANPVERVEAPRVEERSMPFVTPGRMAGVIESCAAALPSALTTAYRVALGAGLRRDELRHLQARDVDLDYGLVVIRSKAMEQAEEGEFRPKGRRDRRVPLNPLARTGLEEAVARVDAPDDLLFSIGADVVEEGRLTKALSGVLGDQGIHLPRPLHALRGHFITYSLLLEWPVPLVQAMAGHRDSSTTMKYWRDAAALLYGDARQRFRDEAVALGFEPYNAPQVGEPFNSYEVGTPGVRPNADETGTERNGAEGLS